VEHAAAMIAQPRWHLVKIWSQWVCGQAGLVAEGSKGLAQIFLGRPLHNPWPNITTHWLVPTLTARHLEGGDKAERGQVGLGSLGLRAPRWHAQHRDTAC
jgi:hypothetical protein